MKGANLFEAEIEGALLENAHLSGAMKPNGDIYD
jgi:uncharacterized protein YjbI with pentapeptide repeats